jgi:peptidoglycan/xylan/chitin deacetylase (PgdA/CDA1 family)
MTDATPAPCLIVSLDFELMWGVRDRQTVASYGANILGVREAVPAILKTFKDFGVHATWAAVGLLLFDRKRDLLEHLPQRRARYRNPALDPYAEIERLGEDERSDPYHYGLSLARMIATTDGMEIGTHTFSHYYCLEPGQDEETFREDLAAAIAATRRIAHEPRSLVFPRNQFNPAYLRACRSLGIACFRGNEASWLYRGAAEAELSLLRRGCRLVDAYLNLSGHNGFAPRRVEGLLDIPSSRFLRPYSARLRALESARLARITTAMTQAARRGLGFHLWWHPHNFGTSLNENLANLRTVLRHFAGLRERFAMASLTMGEYADRHGARAA